MNITNMDTLTIDILNEDINYLGNMLKLQIKPSQNCIVLEEYGLGNVSKKNETMLSALEFGNLQVKNMEVLLRNRRLRDLYKRLQNLAFTSKDGDLFIHRNR